MATLFPLASPINMVTRMLVSNVSFWEVTLSIVLLILSLIGMLLLAARIYRTGILMYGKKPSFKELFQWPSKPKSTPHHLERVSIYHVTS